MVKGRFGKTSESLKYYENSFRYLQEKDEFHCFCCLKPAVSHRMMDHFMNSMGFFNSANFFILSKILIIFFYLFKRKTANECRKTFKQRYGDKNEWVL